MLEIGSTFLSFMITYVVDCILFKQLTNSRKKLMTIRNIVLLVIMSIISCFIDINYGDLPKLILSNIQTCVLLKLVFGDSIFRTITYASLAYIISNATELVFGLIFIVILKNDVSYFTDNIVGYWFTNLTITVSYFGCFFIPGLKEIIKKIFTFDKENSVVELIVLLIFIMSLISSITYVIIIKLSSIQEQITYSLVFIAFVYFIGNFFYQRSKNGELKKSYDYLLDYVKEYEKALEEKSKAQHEYKNQLSVIRGMANKDNKKLHKYIDDMLEVEENKEAHILNSLKPLPTGGLKGLIYYKTASMLKKNMEVHVNVDSVLENGKYWDLCEKNLHNISTIVGVYLDNAIEAAEKAEKKFVIIDIDADEENIIFSFSNTYEGHIEVGKMDKQGYSTKGKSRGYGLSLVQDILNKSAYLKQEREMNGIFYVQKLIIQNKK